MISTETLRFEWLQNDYYVNLGFLEFTDEGDKELFLLCEITDYYIEIYTNESERLGKHVSFNVMLKIKPIDEDWLKQYTDVYGKDEELELLQKGFSDKDFRECEFIKKEKKEDNEIKTYFIYSNVHCTIVKKKEVWTPEEFTGTWNQTFDYALNKYGRCFNFYEEKINK
jgi:hypothetical protein